jgi:GNAT superfamily N-acetyltransferase
MTLFSKPKKVPKNFSSITVRPATSGDVSDVVKLAQSLSIAEGQRPSRLTKAAYLRDGFGEKPAFSALLAEIDREVAGYTLYFEGYDTGRAARGVYLSDLYVDKAWRRQGVGRALMQATAKACKDIGGEWMFWSVLKGNKSARKFYRTISIELTDVIVCATIDANFAKLSNKSLQ